MRQIGFPASGSSQGGNGTVTSVNGVKPDSKGNVELINVPDASLATDAQIDALWQ